MESEAIKWFFSQGVGVGAAAILFWIYRRDVHRALNSWRDQTVILTNLVKEVSIAITANTAAIQAMERTLPHACPMADQMADGAIRVVAERMEKAR